MFSFTYVKIGVAAVFLLGAYAFGWHSRDIDFTKFKDEQKAIAEKQIAENEAKQKEQEIINDNLKQTYEARISNIHTFYTGMLNSRSGAVSSVPNATLTVNGKTLDSVVVAEQCAAETAKLITLQDWVNQQISLNAK